ncbi:2Fe-2S iron-sulfur cluster binding domain-containing protein [Hyphomonas sp. BRH_c22]|uniref:2Fe-2S iron-sulfur cluster binding domain-containing protein n=1 Tax=Hyphomonas sp. BRH_c22 TaxID=1629710 RepID=UPI00262BD2F0|nr:2Fe-2S iron-sulfur cluster binding domain-containing protein [Hyphomonas sp. BRH_c22]
MHFVTVIKDGLSHEFDCAEGEDVLRAMKRANLTVVPVGCRGGGCGVCKVEILGGDFSAGRMSRAHITFDDEQSGRAALACRMYPRGEVTVVPVGRLFKNLKAKMEEVQKVAKQD